MVARSPRRSVGSRTQPAHSSSSSTHGNVVRNLAMNPSGNNSSSGDFAPAPGVATKRISAKNASQSDWEDWGRVLKKLGSDGEDFPVLWIAPGNLGTLGGDWEAEKRFPAFVYADTGFQTPAASQTIPAPQMNPGSSHYDSQWSRT
ncbi:hypothetical protein L596_028864 [Steinernema carpocapsae]|uniref:Uncharacterized protein n=1 Tax=Steinernema carpocapsae TaxID=34508 RepID=A0A4U5LZP8_STECR|nr:hypothetical protein L596_028864 [Steinernema carpocapsae]